MNTTLKCPHNILTSSCTKLNIQRLITSVIIYNYFPTMFLHSALVTTSKILRLRSNMKDDYRCLNCEKSRDKRRIEFVKSGVHMPPIESGLARLLIFLR
jgi:hypothetical protein